jgi:DnaJ family protein C protein 7
MCLRITSYFQLSITCIRFVEGLVGPFGKKVCVLRSLTAISRRATLHEIVRDYGQATIDLQKLTTLLESQQRSKASQPGRLGSSSTRTQDLRQACERLAKAEEEMKRENPLDHYLILGVEASSTVAEIKKAYRKAALRHHPDKAGQFSLRSDKRK